MHISTLPEEAIW